MEISQVSNAQDLGSAQGVSFLHFTFQPIRTCTRCEFCRGCALPQGFQQVFFTYARPPTKMDINKYQMSKRYHIIIPKLLQNVRIKDNYQLTTWEMMDT